jgi:flagellar biosynthesis protein FlhG
MASPAEHSTRRPYPRAPIRLARSIAVTSGKGGVGKSNLAVNIAVAAAQRGMRVCLFDADLGLANTDVLCDLQPRYTLHDVVSGQRHLHEVIMLAPGGFHLIPGASGITRMADLDAHHCQHLVAQLRTLEQLADVFIIDTGAGISANVLAFAAAAQSVVLTTTPEPPAIMDGYATVKALHRRVPETQIRVAVNMAEEGEGRDAFGRIDRVSRTFLRRSLTYAGAIPRDRAVPEAVRVRLPFSLYAPDARATRAVDGLAARLLGMESPGRASEGFLARIARILGVSERYQPPQIVPVSF